MSIIQEAKEIIKLFKSGKLTSAYSDLIRVQRHPTEPLVLLNYTQKTQYLKQWDRTTMLCRGLIINPDTEEIVSLPWKKFFNLNETPETQVETLSSKPFVAFEKLDGSIGISYWIKDEIFLASRGAFNSEEATCGTMYLKQLNWSVLPKELTFLFEIINEGDRCVKRYDFNGIVLLGAINRVTGHELSWAEVKNWATRLGCRVAQEYSFVDLNDIIAHSRLLPPVFEGYVLRFEEFEGEGCVRVKLKGEAYLRLARKVAGITKTKIIQEIIQGTIENFLQTIPEEFLLDVLNETSQIKEDLNQFEIEVRKKFEHSPYQADRKTYACWVNQTLPAKLKSIYFQLYNNQPPLIIFQTQPDKLAELIYQEK